MNPLQNKCEKGLPNIVPESIIRPIVSVSAQTSLRASKPKGPKQGRKNRLRSPMPEGEKH
jgi:hypothetical protein